MNRRICVITGSRAEYGLLRNVLRGLAAAPDVELLVIATGMHLSPEFGSTWHEIEADGFAIDARVETLLSTDTPTGVTKAMGLGLIGFGDALTRLRPDLIVVLGDRFEIFSAAAAALIAGIPIAHLHGGETTEGAYDEALRHSITKMSQLHFVAAEPYRRRVLQLGEDPASVFLVGGLGVDAIESIDLLDRDAVEASLGFKLGVRNLLITFHPVTLEDDTEAQMLELLGALEARTDTQLIFTMPNADNGGRKVAAIVDAFVAKQANAHSFTSLGQQRYLSCLSLVDGVVGNSSSGLAEAPYFKIGTVNIGDRQRGRLRAASVIDCAPRRADILIAIDKLYDPVFRATLADLENPYGTAGASAAIVRTLRDYPLDALVKKRFFDLPWCGQ